MWDSLQTRGIQEAWCIRCFAWCQLWTNVESRQICGTLSSSVFISTHLTGFFLPEDSSVTSAKRPAQLAKGDWKQKRKDVRYCPKVYAGDRIEFLIYGTTRPELQGATFLWKGRLSRLSKDSNGPKHKHCWYITNSHMCFRFINSDLWSAQYFISCIFFLYSRVLIRSEEKKHTKSVGTTMWRK